MIPLRSRTVTHGRNMAGARALLRAAPYAVLEGAAAAVLLLVGGAGSLTALQTASIATAAPFSLVMVAACVAMLRAFRYDLATTPRLLHVSTPDLLPAHRRHDVSATMAGLVSVRTIAPADWEIHPATGELSITEPTDPLAEDEPSSDSAVPARKTTDDSR